MTSFTDRSMNKARRLKLNQNILRPRSEKNEAPFLGAWSCQGRWDTLLFRFLSQNDQKRILRLT